MNRTFLGRTVTLRSGLTVVGLTAGWCALWGSISLANVLSGLVVSVVAFAAVGAGGRGGVRVVPLARFGWLVAVDLVVSTALVLRDVVTPKDHATEGIVAIDLPPGSRPHMLLLFVAITVTPGTAVVAAEDDGSAVYVHILYLERRAAVVAQVRRLAELAIAALPVPPSAEEVRR